MTVRDIARPPARLITRRRLLVGASAVIGAGAASAAWGFGIEPFRTLVTRYSVTPPGWTSGLAVRLAVITDLHVCEPWTGMARLERIVAETNALAPDAVLLLGDFVPGQRIERLGRPVQASAWAKALAGLRSPLGTFAVQGNHDWWEDREAQARGRGPTEAQRALEGVGIPVFENRAVRLAKGGRVFWLAGIGDQWAFFNWRFGDAPPTDRSRRYRGVDDLDGTLAQVTDDAPVVLMIHEPDIFPRVPARVALTVAGHTHGGQVRLFGYAPVVPSRFKNRYAYGHIVEDGRHMIVSAGLGVSGIPVRFGAPPEIVVVDVGGSA